MKDGFRVNLTGETRSAFLITQDKAGKVFFLNREDHAGFELPGGGLKPHERNDPIAGLQRETEVEGGITPKRESLSLFARYIDPNRNWVNVYHTIIDGVNIVPILGSFKKRPEGHPYAGLYTSDHTQFAFFYPSQVEQYVYAEPGTAPLGAGIMFEVVARLGNPKFPGFRYDFDTLSTPDDVVFFRRDQRDSIIDS